MHYAEIILFYSLSALYHIITVVGIADFTTKTLKTFVETTCENQSLYIHCPLNTSIIITSAIYGRPNKYTYSSMMLQQGNLDGEKMDPDKICKSSAFNLSAIVKPKSKICLSPYSMQKVVDVCQDKPECQVFASNKVFKDPCPNVLKYLQVSYKCQPSEFVNKVTCENEELNIECDKNQKIIIFLASYGIQNGGNLMCSKLLTDKHFNCEANSSTEILISQCYGHRFCKVMIDDKTFGNPCSGIAKSYKKYIHVVYSCVHKKILMENYIYKQSSIAANTTQFKDNMILSNISRLYNTTIAFSKSYKFNKTKDFFMINLFGSYLLAKSNKDKFLLYFSLGLCLGLFLLLIYLLTRVFDQKLFPLYVLFKVCCGCCSKGSSKNSKTYQKASKSISFNVFKNGGKKSFSNSSETSDKSRLKQATITKKYTNISNLRYNPRGEDSSAIRYNKFDHNYDSFNKFKPFFHPENFDAALSSTSEF